MRRATSTLADGSSLFPFLAVLLCTMGSLIVLLVVLARQARLDAATATPEPASASAAPESAPPQDDVAARAALEDVELLVGQWEAIRDDTLGGLDDRRRELAWVEDRIRELENDLARRQAEVETSPRRRLVAKVPCPGA